jgi:hypothetical protein
MSTWSTRRLVQVGVLVLIVRVLVDLATPLLPGAFGLDASVSMAAAATSHHVALNPAGPLSPSIAPCAGVDTRSPAEPTLHRRDPGVTRPWPTRASRITYLAERAASSPLSDDD